ncbi:hypothetical protein R3W88_010481 [Solanum pinnatisectum]|uniref:Uncharacterized protein n=1 Tax=Solanum pinnatisectum TaxID=50273 RepID=A0AAV9MH78_9SOLN|nr:hypothetical protein R3W88_010481 [Solanum pinnatisectum]
MISFYIYVSSSNRIIRTKSSTNHTYNTIMANLDQNSVNKSKSINANSTSIFSQARRKMSFRRKKLPVVQPEARGKKQRRKLSPMKIFRRGGLKGQKLQYLGMKKIKDCYWSAVNDILEGYGEVDTFRRQLATETSFAIPVMGFSFAMFSPNPRAI